MLTKINENTKIITIALILFIAAFPVRSFARRRDSIELSYVYEDSSFVSSGHKIETSNHIVDDYFFVGSYTSISSFDKCPKLNCSLDNERYKVGIEFEDSVTDKLKISSVFSYIESDASHNGFVIESKVVYAVSNEIDIGIKGDFGYYNGIIERKGKDFSMGLTFTSPNVSNKMASVYFKINY